MKVYPDETGLLMSRGGLDLLMPMHLWVGPTGHIRHAGPTMQKLFPDDTLIGQRVTEVMEFRRPRGVQTIDDLR